MKEYFTAQLLQKDVEMKELTKRCTTEMQKLRDEL
jgi:hypothetical protein